MFAKQSLAVLLMAITASTTVGFVLARASDPQSANAARGNGGTANVASTNGAVLKKLRVINLKLNKIDVKLNQQDAGLDVSLDGVRRIQRLALGACLNAFDLGGRASTCSLIQ